MEHQGEPRPAELVQVVRLPGLDEAAFRDMHARVVEGGRWPEAIVHHVNGAYDGGWIVIDSWTDTAARDAFFQSRVLPGAGDAPLSGPPTREDLVVHNQMAARTATPA